jgi:hypothetical protein
VTLPIRAIKKGEPGFACADAAESPGHCAARTTRIRRMQILVLVGADGIEPPTYAL